MNSLRHTLSLLIIAILAFSCKKSNKDDVPNSPSACFDGVQNNGETGIDCGGPCSACPRQWTAIVSGTTADLFSVHFVNESNGWAVGVNGTIIHSPDSGNTWSVQSCPVTDTLYSVCFVSSTSGWIAGSKHILKTTNAGNTWSVVPVIDTNQCFYSAFFFDANKGWVGGTNNDWPFLMYTTNGGSAWNQTYTGQFNSQHGTIRSIEFIDELDGFAVGTDANGLALQTTNGSSWVNVNMSAPTMLYGCDFISYSDGWCVGSDNYYYDVNLSQWHYQSALPAGVQLNAVKIISTGQGWAVGNEGTVYKRNDTMNWTIVPNISTSNNLYSVSVSGATGCIVGQGGVVYILK
jgi:photosystem II stability/assembly factor-like uncharacterized protein